MDLVNVDHGIFMNNDVPESNHRLHFYGLFRGDNFMVRKDLKQSGLSRWNRPTFVRDDVTGQIETSLNRILEIVQNNILDVLVGLKFAERNRLFLSKPLKAMLDMGDLASDDLLIHHLQRLLLEALDDPLFHGPFERLKVKIFQKRSRQETSGLFAVPLKESLSVSEDLKF